MLEMIGLFFKVAVIGIAIPFFVLGVMVGCRWKKQPWRRVKLSFLGASVELGEDNQNALEK